MIVTTSEINKFIGVSGVTITSDQSALLAIAGPFVQQKIENIIGYPIEQATYTDYYPSKPTNYSAGGDSLVGNYDLMGGRVVAQTRGDQGRRFIQLRKLPVRSITSVYENLSAWDTAGGSFPASSLLPTNAYYLDQIESGLCESGRLIRQSGVWSRALRTIKVTYVAGLTQAEINASYNDLKLAMLLAIQSFYIGTVMRSLAGANGGAVNSTSITDFSVSFADPKNAGIFFERDFVLPPDVVAILGDYVNLAKYF